MASAKKKLSTLKKNKQNSSTKTKTALPQTKIHYTKKESKKPRPFHAAGGLLTEHDTPSYHDGLYQQIDPNIIKTHIPQYKVVPYSNPKRESPKPLSAATINSIKKRSKGNVFFPKFFMNPYQDLDYMVLQDIYANSIAGRIIDRLVELMFGNGVKPILKLRNPKEFGDEEKQQQEIEAGQKILDDLLAVDEALSDPDDEVDPFLDTDINTKFLAIVKNSLVYGRSMAIKTFNKPVKLQDGRVFANIPDGYKIIHPRDMGIVEIDQATWKLKSVQIRFTAQNVIPQQMIYMENGSNNPVFNALHYGYSTMQSMIGASRSLKQMIEIDFPTITKHVWAGIGFGMTKPDGATQAQKQEELEQILAQIKAGRMNWMMLDPNDTRIDFQDFNPKITELVQLADFLIRYNIAQTGMPQALFAQEQDSNRSTLVQKIRFFMDGPIKNLQESITAQFSKQHYMPNFKAMYGKDSEEFKKFKIVAEFEPLKLEAFDDSVEAVIRLNEQFPLLPSAAGELLGLDNFESMIDTSIERPDPNRQGFGFVDKNGDNVEMKRKQHVSK